jgi:methyltransferase-like protein
MALDATALRDDIVTDLFPDFSQYDQATQDSIRDVWGKVASNFINHFINNAEISITLDSDVVNRIGIDPSETYEIDNLDGTGGIVA